ncbi:MAG: tetratricopeptide repeat protein [Candidatus Latescibacterota bacterium]|nr:MAG: tetratricopeptide repeat protein [Candidatus Latescibacterota bacterium]
MFLKRFFKFIPKNDYSRALDLFNEGYYRKALKIFEDLLARSVEEEELDMPTVELFACESHVALSKQNLNGGNLGGAIDEMSMAVELKPQFADLRFNLGNLLVNAKRLRDAHQQFERALEINPKFFKARINLARVLMLSGDKGAAVHTLDDAQRDCPNFYRDNLEQLVQMVRMNDDEENVTAAFREILDDRPSSAQVRREIAIEAIQNGDNAEAIRELKKSIAVNPDYPDLHNYLGIAYGNSGMVDDSIEEFETALKINPYYMKARLNLALALYDQGRFVESRSHIEKVLSVKPENQLAQNLLAELNAVADRK